MTTRNIGRLLGVMLACGTTAALAQLNQNCVAQWHNAVAAQSLAEACKAADAAAIAKFKSSEDSMLNCAVAQMQPAEAADFRANAAKTRVEITKAASSRPCPPDAKLQIQDRAAKLSSAPASSTR